MVYRVIGLMSGSSMDGLDIAFVDLQETGGQWTYELRHADCYEYPPEWIDRLRGATTLKALDYQLLHVDYGRYIGEQVNRFIAANNIQYQVQLIASHGHTSFHIPEHHMTGQLGDGASIAALTGINVVSDLRAMDMALGGQGAPIVPVGEQKLLGSYRYFLNLGGIANISYNHPEHYIAFDICPANRVLNMLVKNTGKAYDDGGQLAAKGTVNQGLLDTLNSLEYYALPYPKSLANDFGTDVVFPLIAKADRNNALRTYIEHICQQVARAVSSLPPADGEKKMLVTGGGAHNTFLVERLTDTLQRIGITVEVPDSQLIDFKEAIVMALIGILRWREEYNVFASVTGASRNSINGAVWIGQEA